MQVLIENGFTPEWIQLLKEIRQEKEDLREELVKARNGVGPLPLSPADEASWKDITGDFRSTTKRINNKIDKYNLLVPILQKQMLHVRLEDIADEVLSMPPQKITEKYSNYGNMNSNYSVDDVGIVGLITSFFNKKIS